jgi:hypothetical protein
MVVEAVAVLKKRAGVLEGVGTACLFQLVNLEA